MREQATPVIVRIDSLDDPRVEDFRNVPDPLLVRRRGLFVAEGRLVVERLLTSPGYCLRALLLTETALAHLQRRALWDGLEVPVYLTSPSLLQDIGGYHFHQGCLGLAERPRSASLHDVVDAVRPGRPLLVLERVGNPDNVGGIFRNAAALGAGAVVLSPGCADPLYRKSVRTSLGAVLLVPHAVADDWPAALRALGRRGWAVVALTPDEGALPLGRYEPPVGARLALLLGNEGDGLSREALAGADVRVRIPVEPPVDSLNVATAAAVALHDLRTRRRRDGSL